MVPRSLTTAQLSLTLLLLSLIGSGGLTYLFITERDAHRTLKEQYQQLNQTLLETATQLTVASTTLATTTAELFALKEEYGLLTEDSEEYQREISHLSRTVTVLDKLSKTDRQLLQKYSKVSFLNEHYVPESLSPIPKALVYDESRDHQIHTKVLPFLNDMIENAKEAGIDLWVVSGYRSFEQQALLKGQYLVTYGSGANAFSADQGFSEHQLGTTVDFTTRGLRGGLTGFQNTEAFTWLQANAHKYGFILSYPEGNQFYIFEPWHWRFVGEDLARDLHRENAHFYDWEQRRIDEYLLNIFE